jgi:hypothetical protein
MASLRESAWLVSFLPGSNPYSQPCPDCCFENLRQSLFSVLYIWKLYKKCDRFKKCWLPYQVPVLRQSEGQTCWRYRCTLPVIDKAEILPRNNNPQKKLYGTNIVLFFSSRVAWSGRPLRGRRRAARWMGTALQRGRPGPASTRYRPSPRTRTKCKAQLFSGVAHSLAHNLKLRKQFT